MEPAQVRELAREIVEEIIFEVMDKSKSEYALNSELSSLGDSLELIELLNELEDEFNTEISPEQAMELKTVNDVITLVENLENLE